MCFYTARGKLGVAALALLCADALSAPSLPAECKIRKADTVVIGSSEGQTTIGAIEYPMGSGGDYTGRPGAARPAGPVIVYIFRKPTDAQLADARKILPSARAGAAFHWPKGAHPREMRYLCDVDANLNTDQLAALFGASSGKTPAKTGTAKGQK